MVDFTPHCNSRAHCHACRTDAEWRKAVNAPDTCPHGVTAEMAEAERQAAIERFKLTHPDGAPPASGCCDSALNYEKSACIWPDRSKQPYLILGGTNNPL